jgi:hypothetical protein
MYGLSTGNSLLDYGRETSLETIQNAVAAHANEVSKRKARFKSVVARSDPIEAIETFWRYSDDTDLSITEHGDHYEINLTRTIRRSDLEGGQRHVSGSFALYQNPESADRPIWTAVTGHDADFFENGLCWLLHMAAPELYSFYLNTSDLEQVLNEFVQSLPPSAQLQISKAIGYSHSNDEGNISFETRPHEEVFRISEERNRYVDKIRFTATHQDRTLLDAFISRDGEARFSSGNPDLHFDNLMSVYNGLGYQKSDLFEHRERSKETGSVQQIEIEFSEPLFTSPRDNQLLISALEHLPKSSVTVYHSNPYAHLTVLDFIDGSNCDVFITESDTVSIMPGYRGSSNSLMRISEQISRELREGTIELVQEESYEVSDFF